MFCDRSVEKSQKLSLLARQLGPIFFVCWQQELQHVLQADEMVLLCKLEEELGFKSEQQLRESVELQGEQLSKMDEKLIQLFEVLYILETAETNFQDELHLVATEGAAVFTNSRVLSTVSQVTLCSEERFKTQRRFSEPKVVF